jgi:glycosyltransferase involved in cell wall biosynthesis
MAGPSVTFLGWQSDEVIRDHYRRCRALIFPGEEDFGIVPIEALGCEAPVIALGRGGAAETVDDLVGRTYPAPTIPSLTAALDSWEHDGLPHNPSLARVKAEALALPIFRRRFLGYLSEVMASKRLGRAVPPPHLPGSGRIEEWNRQDAKSRQGRKRDGERERT